MATHEVSTWAELVTALTSHSSGDTIKLTADINCNGPIPSGVSSTINCGSDAITITGAYIENDVTKNHIITNLRTSASSPVSIFSFGGTNHSIYINNIDFKNLILDKPLFYCIGTSTPPHIYIQNCRFIGRRSDYLMSVDNFINHLSNCYFNIKYTGTNIDKVSMCEYESWAEQTAENCIFYDYVASGCINASPSGGKPCSSAHPFKLSGCRISGELTVVYPWDTSIVERYTYASPIQNVVDAVMACRVDTSSNIQVYAPKGVWLKSAYKYSDKTVTGYTFENKNSGNGAIDATASQIKDASWLANQNFDIVVPNT